MKRFLASRWGIIIIVIGGLFLVILFGRIGGWKPIENVTQFAFNPVQDFFHNSALKIKNFVTYFDDIKKLKDENETLKDEIAELTSKNNQLKKMIDEGDVLKEELEFVTEYNYDSVSAKVIGFGSDEYQQVLILNKGRQHGVINNMPVIVNNGILVGKIYSVSERISKIRLLNDNHSQVSAQIKNDDKSQGIVSGQFGLTLKMDLIPHEHRLDINQIVTTSGIEEFTPAELVIGKISQIDKLEGEIFQKATIIPSVDYQKIDIVTILITQHDK